MQSTINSINPTKIKINIAADKEQLNRAKAETLKKLGASVRLPGFRQGKAPNNLVEKYVDANNLSRETLEKAVNEIYMEALIFNKIRPIMPPEINVLSYVPYTQLEFEATVDIIGKVELGKYTNLDIKNEKITVNQSEINSVITRMQRQLATKKSVKRSAKLNDEVLIDFNGYDPKTKEAIAGGIGKDYPLVLGSKAFIPGFEEGLIGAKIGEDKELKLTFPQDYGIVDLRSKKINFKVHIKNINELSLPAIDDDLAKLVGPFEDIKQLRENIKKELISTKKENALANIQNQLVDQLINSSNVDFPEQLTNEEAKRIENEQRQNAAYNQLTWSEYLKNQGLTKESFTKAIKQQAEIRIKTGLVLGELANKEGIFISNEEFKNKIDQLKKQYANDEKMISELNDINNQEDIKNRLLVEKTVSLLVDKNNH